VGVLTMVVMMSCICACVNNGGSGANRDTFHHDSYTHIDDDIHDDTGSERQRLLNDERRLECTNNRAQATNTFSS
jgi:hypothetical protein